MPSPKSSSYPSPRRYECVVGGTVPGLPWVRSPAWLLSDPLPLPLPLPLLPLLEWLSRALLAWCESLTCSPCCLAKALTHGPIPRTPDARSVVLHVATVCFTCWPQTLGFRLPVVATSVITPAPAAASAATAKPVASLAAIAAPVPPRSRFMNPPEAGVLHAGIEAESTGPRIRFSSRSISRSKSLMCPTSVRRDAVLRESTHLDLRLRFRLMAERPSEVLFGGGQPRRHGALRHAQGRPDLAVRVPVVVAQDDGGRLLRRQLAQGLEQVRPLGQARRVRRRRRPADAPEHLPDLAHALVALVRD